MDKRLQKNLQKIGKKGPLNLYVWEWNEGAKSINAYLNDPVGFIAQEVQEVYPEFVVDDNPDGYLRINYQGLLARLAEEEID